MITKPQRETPEHVLGEFALQHVAVETAVVYVRSQLGPSVGIGQFVLLPVVLMPLIHQFADSPTPLLAVDGPFGVVLAVLQVGLQLVQAQRGCAAEAGVVTADL